MVSFEQHLRDVILLFAYFQQKEVQEKNQLDGSPGYLFFDFILRRAYPKIRARVMNGENMWGDHPIRIIQQWLQDPEKRNEVKSTQLTMPRVVRKHLALDGIEPLDAEAEDLTLYSVSNNNAHHWGASLLRLLETLERNLPAVRSGSGRDTIPQPPVDSKGIHNAMRVLDALLRAKLLDKLVTKPLEDHLSSSYIQNMKPDLLSAQLSPVPDEEKISDGEEPF